MENRLMQFLVEKWFVIAIIIGVVAIIAIARAVIFWNEKKVQ